MNSPLCLANVYLCRILSKAYLQKFFRTPLVKDEGAVTFRVIDDSIESPSALYNMPNMKITYAAAIKILSKYNFYVII